MNTTSSKTLILIIMIILIDNVMKKGQISALTSNTYYFHTVNTLNYPGLHESILKKPI